MINPSNIPRHVAIIMDGNGRWAKARGLPKIAGHRAGVKTAQDLIKAAKDLGIKFLTLYTFSTENWKRPKNEIEALFKLLEEYLNKVQDKFNENNIRFCVIGKRKDLPDSITAKIDEIEKATRNNTGLTLNLALNYGSRPEIIGAVRKISSDVKEGKLKIEDIDENSFANYLYTKGMPDPDLLIRTSGELRVSNFLLWQIAYSELYVTKKLWPDFKTKDFEKAIAEYQKRERRFGG